MVNPTGGGEGQKPTRSVSGLLKAYPSVLNVWLCLTLEAAASQHLAWIRCDRHMTKQELLHPRNGCVSAPGNLSLYEQLAPP